MTKFPCEIGLVCKFSHGRWQECNTSLPLPASQGVYNLPSLPQCTLGARKHKRAVTISPEAHGQWAILYLWTIVLCEESVRRRCWVTASCSFTTATTAINYCRAHNATLTKKHSWMTTKETHIVLWRVQWQFVAFWLNASPVLTNINSKKNSYSL